MNPLHSLKILDMFSDPTKNIEQFGLTLGQSVADFGSGSGHYVISCAKVVGDAGHVYAVDIQKDLLGKVKNEASKLGLSNIDIVWGDLEKERGSKLRDQSVDAVIISNLMFQMTDKKPVAVEAFRITKEGGSLLLIDWADSFGGIGPQRDRVFTHDEAVQLFTEAGFTVKSDIDVGAHHYGIVFAK